MSTPITSPELHMTEEMKKLKHVLGTKVHSFFKCLTAEQWDLLKSCTPDESTNLQMSELLLQICNTLSNVFLTKTWTNMFSEEEIHANLGNLVTDTFKSALDINDNIQCDSADSLQKLIHQEVADTVNNPQSTVPARPMRLHMMVMHAVEMMKTFLERMKKVVTCQSAKRSSTPKQELLLEETSSNEGILIDPDVEREDAAAAGAESGPTVEENREMFVQIIIEKLFCRIFNKTKNRNLKEHKDILQRLIDRTWAEVQYVDFSTSQKNLENFDQKMFKDLCKRQGCAEQVLLSLKKEDDVLFDSVVSIFKSSAVPKVSILQRIRNFFASLCRRRHRVGVADPDGEAPPDGTSESGEMIEPLAIPVFEFEPALEARKKAFLEVVIEKLFCRICKKTHCLRIKDDNAILRRLMERTWAEVEDIDFELSKKNLHDLDGAVFKNLSKKMGGANRVLMAFKMEDETIVMSIVDTFNWFVAPKPTKAFSWFSKSR